MTTRNRELASIIDASGNITTGGNLSVAGNLTQTNSTTTSYSDGLLELNSGAGSNSNDLGLVMERGSTGDNAIFLWDESNDTFAVGTTTAVGTATGNISFSAAPFTASTITGTILTGSTSVKTPLIEYTDGDDAITIADGGHITTGANLSIGGSNNELRFYEGSNYVGFEAPALSADQIWVLPTADGSSGQILKTDGSGNLSFTDDLTLANASVNNFSGNGSTTGFTLSTTPVSENATQVYINGVYQFKNTYSVSGTTLTFDAAPPNGSSIEALVWSTVAINTPADASVTNSSLNASVITGQSEVTAAGADHVLIYDASATALKKALVSDFGNTDEEIQDIVGAMFSSNTETGISVTYQDGDGTLDLVIGDDSIVSSMLDTNIDIAGTLDVTGVLTTDTNATIAGTLGIAGGSSNGVQISQGAIAIKNGGSKSYIDLYCESSNAHYTRIEAAAHSAYSGNVTVTLPVATGTLALTSGSVATVTGAAQSAITSLGTLTTLTVDEMTLNADTLTASDDFIIDAVGDITLDAADNQIFFKDNGTTVGTLSMTDSDLKIISGVSDKDIILAGSDGGSEVVALTLDMSDAGTAIFNNKVGIGTTSPDRLLDVSGTGNVYGKFQSTNATGAGIEVKDTGEDWLIQADDGTGSGGLAFYDLGRTAYRMFLNASGNLGIGTTSPAETLHVKRADGTALIVESSNDQNNTGDRINIEFKTDAAQGIAKIIGGKEGNYQSQGARSGYLAFQTINANSYAERMRITTAGNVGINETSPDFSGFGSNGGGLELDDVGSSFTAVKISQGSTGNLYLAASTGAGYLWQHSNSPLIIGTNNAERIRIQDGTGRMGINSVGTAYASAEKLSLQNDNFGFGIKTTSTCAGLWNSGTSGTYIGFAYGSGGAGGGGITFSGASTSYTSASDYRLKENVDYAWDATTRLKQLKPARFNWISDSTNTLQDGFLAHEVSSIVPEAVIGEKDAVYTVEEAENDAGAEAGDIKAQTIDHAKLVPLLVKTIQELEARITTLEG